MKERMEKNKLIPRQLNYFSSWKLNFLFDLRVKAERHDSSILNNREILIFFGMSSIILNDHYYRMDDLDLQKIFLFEIG
jgi:hypothetical protein